MEILEAKIIYEKGKISRVFVLADYSSDSDFSDVRATGSGNRTMFGYPILIGSRLTDDLVKNVAQLGFEVSAEKEFPGWKKRYSKK